MTAIYWNSRMAPNWRISDCPSAVQLMQHTRIHYALHWRWDDSEKCYQTHRWSSDARYIDVRSWPGETALSSLLAACRGDERLAGDPFIPWFMLYIALEYTKVLAEERGWHRLDHE